MPAAAGELGLVVAEALGLRVEVLADPTGRGFGGLAGLALRDNPRRAHLVVSRVLAKHIPVPAPAVLAAAGDLAGLVAAALGREREPLVLGFCETATALGWQVADVLRAPVYAHSTRRPGPAVLDFREDHSHAADHALQVAPDALADPRPLVLVDDELTTGATALNTIEALQRRWPRADYVVAALLDLRNPSARGDFEVRASRLGARVRVVALLDAVLHVPADVLARAAGVRAELAAQVAVGGAAVRGLTGRVGPGGTAPVVEHPGLLPAVATARHGVGVAAREALRSACRELAAGLRLTGPATLVLGTEELLQPAVLLAAALGSGALVQSTTRSPVLAFDLPGYAVRRVLTAPAPGDSARLTRLHNLTDPAALAPQQLAVGEAPGPPYDDVVILVDTPAAAARPLAEALRGWARGGVHVLAAADTGDNPRASVGARL